MTLKEVVCFRCDHVFEVAGEVGAEPECWYCPDCVVAIEELLSEPSYPTAGPSERERWEQAADCGRRR